MSTIGVFIDQTKAFDTINHNMLINKLEHYGVRCTANKWIVNYHNGRQQYIQIDNVHSGYKEVIHGIPQGSIIGPRLFIAYFNYMCNYFLFVACYKVFIQSCLRFSLCFPKTNYYGKVRHLS